MILLTALATTVYLGGHVELVIRLVGGTATRDEHYSITCSKMELFHCRPTLLYTQQVGGSKQQVVQSARPADAPTCYLLLYPAVDEMRLKHDSQKKTTPYLYRHYNLQSMEINLTAAPQWRKKVALQSLSNRSKPAMKDNKAVYHLQLACSALAISSSNSPFDFCILSVSPCPLPTTLS